MIIKNKKAYYEYFVETEYNSFGPNIHIQKQIQDNYYEVIINNHFIILSAENIIAQYHKNLVA